MTVQALLFSSVVPVVLAGVLLGLLPLAQRLRGFALTERLSGAMGALALGLAYCLSHPGVRGQLPDVPPVDATNWPWVLAPLTVVVAAVEGYLDRVPPVRWTGRALLIGVGVYLVARPHVTNEYADAPEAGLAIFVFALVVVVYTFQLDALRTRPAQPPTFLALVLAVSCSAGVCVLGSTASLGQLCGILAAGLFAVGLISWLRPEVKPLAGVVPVLGITHGLILLGAYLYAYVPASAAALLALTPGAAWVSRAGKLKRIPAWSSLVVSLVLILCLGGLAGALTHRAAPGAGGGDEYGDVDEYDEYRDYGEY